MASGQYGYATQPIDYPFDIVLIGDSEVGKSQIRVRFTQNNFSFNFKTTSSTARTGFDIEKSMDARVWDISGYKHYAFADGAILVYDVTKRKSFDHIPHWLEELRIRARKDIVIILIGNKCDLLSQRVVFFKDAEKFAQKEGLLFLETSALVGTNVEEAVATLLTRILTNVHNKKKNFVTGYDQDKGKSQLLGDMKIKSQKIPAKMKSYYCGMDLIEVLGLLPICWRSAAKRIESSIELLKLKAKFLLDARDSLEVTITKELMLGKPSKETQIWLAMVEDIEPKICGVLKLEQKGSRLDASWHKTLMNLLDEVAVCFEKSPLELARMVDAPYEKTKRKKISDMRTDRREKLQEEDETKAIPHFHTGTSPALGKETEQDNEMRQSKDGDTLIAPYVDCSIPMIELEMNYESETAEVKTMYRRRSKAPTVNTAGVAGGMTPSFSDEPEAESEKMLTLLSESSSFSGVIPTSKRNFVPNSEIILPHETEIEFVPFDIEEILSRPETDILSIHESEITSVPPETQEVNQVGSNPAAEPTSVPPETQEVYQVGSNPAPEPTLSLAVSLACPISSIDDTLLTDQAAIELRCQTAGGPVPEPRTSVKRSIEHTVQNILECINDVKTRRTGIYGNGGIGKTTVLKALINYQELNNLFDLIIWVTVSKYWSTRKIQNVILRQLALSSADSETNSEIAEKLFQALRFRRFLLILDDVWDLVDLDAVGIPDPSKEVGCRIIIAARSSDVCHIMAADREIKVVGLSKEEAWELFHKQLDKSIDSLDILPFARVIVEECGGLPLTIIVTGRALRHEKDALVWRLASREYFLPSSAGLHETEAVIQQLKFSYDRLRSREIKSFFLYCALFPQAHDINLSALIEYCVEEGLISGDLEDAHKMGHNIIELLVNAALLERNEDSLSVKMHDMIRDLALWVLSEEECCQFPMVADLSLTQFPSIRNSSLSRTLENSERNQFSLSESDKFLLRAGVGLTKSPSKKEWENAKMICLMDNKISSLPETPSCPNLLTLFLQRNYPLRVIPTSFFDCMPSLQVLNLSATRIKSLPQSLSKLVSLQALILRNCDRLVVLPSEVGLLGRLEILDLQGTEINKLPDEIGKLDSLKHLDVSFYGCTNRSELIKLPHDLIPRGIISSLLALEKLSVDVYPGDHRWIRSVDSVILEVGSLTRLTFLCFYFPEVELLKLFLQMSPSWKGKGLTKFKFVVGHNVKRMVTRVPEDVDFDYGRRGRCLRFVNSDMIPEAVLEVLTHTTAFYLDHHLNIGSLSEFGLGTINGLKFCVVRECPEMHTVIDRMDVTNAALPFLERLSIHYLWNLKRIWKGMMPSGSFASLRILSVHTCPKLSFVFSHSMLHYVANLEELIVEDCPAIKEIVLQDNAINSCISILPCLKKLKLHYLPELVNIWEGPWPSLEQISFYNCTKLKNIGMDSKLKHTLKEIKAEKDWWGALEWEETALFLHLQARFSQITDHDL